MSERYSTGATHFGRELVSTGTRQSTEAASTERVPDEAEAAVFLVTPTTQWPSGASDAATVLGEESRTLLRLLDPVKRVDASEARKAFSSLLREVGQSRGSILITRYGKAEAALVAYPTVTRTAKFVYRIADAYGRLGTTEAHVDELPGDLGARVRGA